MRRTFVAVVDEVVLVVLDDSLDVVDGPVQVLLALLQFPQPANLSPPSRTPGMSMPC